MLSGLTAPAGAKFIQTFTYTLGGYRSFIEEDLPLLAKFDMLALSRYRYASRIFAGNSWDTIKSLNPDIEIFTYLMGAEAYNNHDDVAVGNLWTLGRYDSSRGHSMGSLNGDNSSLFLLNSKGERIYNAGYSNTGQNQYCYLMDFGSTAYQDYWIEVVETDVPGQSWESDGIIADNCLALIHGGYSDTSVIYNTNSKWAQGMNDFIVNVGSGLNEFSQKFWINRCYSQSRDGYNAWLALDSSQFPPYAVMEEGAFAVSWGPGDVMFYAESGWKRQVDLLQKIRNSKVTYLAHSNLEIDSSGTDNYGDSVTFWQILWYSMCSYLLGKNDSLNNGYFMFGAATRTSITLTWEKPRGLMKPRWCLVKTFITGSLKRDMCM
jgi:hypothetical protein